MSELPTQQWKIAVFCRFRPAVDRTEQALSTSLSSAARGRLNGGSGGRDSLIEYSVDATCAGEDGSGPLRHGLDVRVPPDADTGLIHNNPSGSLRFEFDRVFDVAASQETIFEVVARDKVVEVFQGINSTIFAYGQTGSGKTFTVAGGDNFQQRGLIPRTVGCIFEEAAVRTERKTHTIKCHVSFAEVYKENVYDLLDPQQRELPIKARVPVQVLESESGLVMKNISVYEVSEEKDALSLFFMGIANRISDATTMNSVSSRSHAIFTIIVDSESVDTQGRAVFTSAKINLVDLAGSERMYKMHNTKGMIKEAKSINLSLHFLEQVIVSLRDCPPAPSSRAAGKPPAPPAHVPYRNSTLTSILRDSLGGNCKSCFILTLSQERLHFEETVSTCRFGQRCGEVRVQVSANAEISLMDQLRDQAARIRQLEKALEKCEAQKARALADGAAEKALRISTCELRPLTEQEQDMCKARVDDLLAAAKAVSAPLASPSSSSSSSSFSSFSSSSSSSSSPSPSPSPSNAAAAAAAAAQAPCPPLTLDDSQNAFFLSVSQMDHAVCVELCAALASLVQTVYVDREKVKRSAAAAAAAEKNKLALTQARLVPAADKGNGRMEPAPGGKGELSPRRPLQPPDEGSEAAFVALLNKGERFAKLSRYGRKHVRHVAVSADFGHIYWHHMGNPATPTTLLLSDFDRVEIAGKARSGLTLHGRPGKRSLQLEYVNGPSLEATWALVTLWHRALSFAGADGKLGARENVAP